MKAAPRATEELRPSSRAGVTRRESAITPGALRAFVAIAESGSVSRAATELGLAQPTVSIQLNNLEQACGVTLFYRRPKISLTEAGRELFVRARQILSRFDDFEAYTRDLTTLEKGRLTLGTSTPAFAMPLLAKFSSSHPAIAVRTTIGNTSSLTEELLQCRIDVAVMTLDAPIPSMECVLIAPQRLRLCVPAGHPLSTKAEVHVAELPEYPLVVREPGSMTRRLLEQAFEQREATLRGRLEVGSREAVREAIAAGIGVGVLLEGELRGDTRLTEVPLTGTTVTGGVYAVALKEGADIPAVSAFLRQAVSFSPSLS